VYGDATLMVGLKGGTGSGATAQVTVAGGKVTDVRLVSPGKGFTAGDLLTFNDAALGPRSG
jgi:hypothetical protein